MRKFLNLMLLTSFLALTSGVPLAADRGTADEAVALVKRAVAYYKTNGREKLLAEINNPNGQFVDRDMYLFVSEAKEHAVTLAHGNNPRMVGKVLYDIKDAEGKPFVQKFTEVANSKEGKGWVDYKWPNPVTKGIDSKTTYIEKAGDLLIGCGIYK